MKTPNEIFSQYVELSIDDKMKFDYLFFNHKKNNHKNIEKYRGELLNQLSTIKDIYGNNYFDEGYLKNKLKDNG